ncbi:SMC-Scp complex subunit ScpB [Flaviaesturariibacter amylovorans]|uniref:SMC-Scp complex subunit ScpB n=1 Tax=Flaviaesturariibacter amylovorans TaxID=1084520 RepID=A0ABP8HTN2_9BACT
MEISSLIPHIESLIFASDKPLMPAEITELINQAFGFMEDKVLEEQVTAALEGIVEKYSSEFYPFEVRMSGGGWQFLTKKEFHKTVAQLNGEKFLKRLSAAALETLAIIAYKQPITKGEIETIRGVSSDYSVQKLLEKELIVISGRNEKMPGHPLVYATSKSFMDYFGINSPSDLPKIREVLAEQAVQATLINPEDFHTSGLAVTDDGELIEEQPGTGASDEALPQQTVINGKVVDEATGEVIGDEPAAPATGGDGTDEGGSEAGDDNVPEHTSPEGSEDTYDSSAAAATSSPEAATEDDLADEEEKEEDDASGTDATALEEEELSEADFPDDEQEEIRIDETSDEIIFTTDDLDGALPADLGSGKPDSDDPLADDDSPANKDIPDAP